jgi:hypothetical protein
MNLVCSMGRWPWRCATTVALGFMLSVCGSPLCAQSEPVPAPNLDSAVGEQTLRGRLTCARLSVVSYTCGHSKNEPVWGCTLHCAKGPDGSQYVLQTDNKTYSVTGDPKRLRHFAGDDVVVSGELSGYAIRAFSIAKPSRKANRNNLVAEPNWR